MTAPAPPTNAASGSAATSDVPTFHELLSEMNPLQYLPVVGTLYRSLTGDVIPESVRQIGSMVVSGLIGGPIGVAINIATLAAEKATGIDPEAIGHRLLADIGIGNDSAPAEANKVATPAAAIAPASSSIRLASAAPAPASTASPVAWSASQLAAYGITTSPGGDLRGGDLSGSDVLNALELARHGTQATN